MATLQVRDLDDRLYDSLRTLAKHEHRSISQQVAYVLEQYLSGKLQRASNPTAAFLELAGSWEDPRSAEVINKDLRAARNTGNRTSRAGDVFD